MKNIVSITVIKEPSASKFEKALMKKCRELQDDAGDVTINNPHLVAADGMFNYIAVVEARYDPFGG